ncbi:MAG: hypothetical protein JW954_02545 [Dehalococcoidaceae bacterium]|nr:hypothetical protein [Dehalococcoidaceae bacterium]
MKPAVPSPPAFHVNRCQGGENFLIIPAGAGSVEVARVAERIRYKDDINIEVVIDRADKTLCQAKQKGRNRVEA